MERFEINYSKKNIPIPSEKEYKILLLSKVERFTKRMRWKALEFLGKLGSTRKETFGFKSTRCPQPVNELAAFEADLISMIKNLEFRSFKNTFQQKLKDDVKYIKESDNLLVLADKSTNIYKVDKSDYEKYVLENVTKTYKKSNNRKVSTIDHEAKRITSKFGIEDRVQKIQKREAFITIKDHKEGFPNKLSFRLLNPSKSEIGKISKQLLDNINKSIISSTKVNQWKNTSDVISWFNQIQNKPKCSFINFDVENFYPSISEKLFKDSIIFAKKFTNIDDADLNIIMQSRKTLLFYGDEPWVKKIGDEDFDVPMGSYDGAEVCELVGSYILSLLSKIVNKSNIGLYRDDGLGYFEDLPNPVIERKKKSIVKAFKDCGLSITIECNMKSVNFLDVTFNLASRCHKPYRKPNNEPLYINVNSNHPPNVIKQLPISIEKRISETSSNKEIFDSSIHIYREALVKSGYKNDLNYMEPENQVDGDNDSNNETRRRKRKIIWFNPPFSASVKTNIGKTFLRLLEKHFPNNHPMHKIYNKNTVKISYSCMRNIESIISSHNKNLLHPKPKSFGCNCRAKAECPLRGSCLTPQIIYRADVINITTNEMKFYIGLAETSFKERFSNHKKDMKHEKYKNSTELAKYVWSLKDQNIPYSINWSIVNKVYGSANIDMCNLCLTEKLLIIESINDTNMLNKRSEFINKCRHINKFMLNNLKASGVT